MLPASNGGQAWLLQDMVFSDAYSGAKDPMSLAAFLHTWWLNAEEHQASYQQQDAHEFYLSALFGLGNSADSTSLPLCGRRWSAPMHAPCDRLPQCSQPRSGV